MSLKQKTAIVTGGNGGIGKAIVRELIKQNIKTLIVGRNAKKGEDTVNEMKALGGDVHFVQLDLSNTIEIREFCEDLDQRGIQIDILINNAGISGHMGPVMETPLEELHKTFRVNMEGIFLLTQLILKGMSQLGWGRIVNISSIAYRRNPANSACYNLSKAALNSFTQTLSAEVGKYGITVNAVAPGLILTDRIKQQRLPGMAEKAGISENEMLSKLTEGTATGKLTDESDIAHLTAFLASEQAGSITGEIIDVAAGA